MRTLFVALMIGAFATVGNAAKICDVNATCSGSTLEMKECMAALLKDEDRQLNDNYNALITHIQSAGFSDPDALEWKLRQSQRRWITYRDDYCDFRFATAEGGTIGGLLILDCKCTLTRDKAEHLRDDLVP